MPVRLATRADIPIMATVLSAAFGPDSLFQHLFPYQDEYPQDMESAMRENLWLAFYDVKKVLMISYESTPKDGGEEEGGGERQALIPRKGRAGEGTITGLAEWERGVNGKGAGFANGFWGQWDPRKFNPAFKPLTISIPLSKKKHRPKQYLGRLMKPLLSTFYRVRRIFIPNRATNRLRPTQTNPKPMTYWNFGPIIFPFVKQFMAAPHRAKHWSLEILGVHPAHQGKGYGKELVQRGLEVLAQGDPEGDLPACVVAADGKEEFYRRVGFPELVGWVSRSWDENGKENPFRGIGVGGGAVLWSR
ncbi:hypothetical protein H2200_004511 [Cladophialophora chaetospira]|uniref:N-acetyltransferase domain-containing protein n=1 Tax=Cladophialophora chaetospira TaxID=386627 RepID=A0AA39CJJ5_9EURO|nr:hypothetical protein H2200_004511 [Cladophialophora chaetospira]